MAKPTGLSSAKYDEGGRIFARAEGLMHGCLRIRLKTLGSLLLAIICLASSTSFLAAGFLLSARPAFLLSLLIPGFGVAIILPLFHARKKTAPGVAVVDKLTDLPNRGAFM